MKASEVVEKLKADWILEIRYSHLFGPHAVVFPPGDYMKQMTVNSKTAHKLASRLKQVKSDSLFTEHFIWKEEARQP